MAHEGGLTCMHSRLQASAATNENLARQLSHLDTMLQQKEKETASSFQLLNQREANRLQELSDLRSKASVLEDRLCLKEVELSQAREMVAVETLRNEDIMNQGVSMINEQQRVSEIETARLNLYVAELENSLRDAQVALRNRDIQINELESRNLVANQDIKATKSHWECQMQSLQGDLIERDEKIRELEEVTSSLRSKIQELEMVSIGKDSLIATVLLPKQSSFAEG